MRFPGNPNKEQGLIYISTPPLADAHIFIQLSSKYNIIIPPFAASTDDTFFYFEITKQLAKINM